MPPNPTPATQPPPTEADRRQAQRFTETWMDALPSEVQENAAEALAAALAQARRDGRRQQLEADCARLCPHCAAGEPGKPGPPGGMRWRHPKGACGAGRLREGGEADVRL